MATPIQGILLIWEHKGLRAMLKQTPLWGPQDTRFWYGRYQHMREEFLGVEKSQRTRKKKGGKLHRDRRGLKGVNEEMSVIKIRKYVILKKRNCEKNPKYGMKVWYMVWYEGCYVIWYEGCYVKPE